MVNIWTCYQVRWDFLTKLCGSVPAKPEIIAAWLESRKPKNKPLGGKSLVELNEEVLQTLAEPEEEEAQGSILTFQSLPTGLVMRAGTIRAHIKDCARVLSNQYVKKLENATGAKERAFSTRVINGVYIDEATYWVPILRPDGSPIFKADGTMDKAVHVKGPKGQPMNALKQFEYIEPAMMTFRLKTLGTSIREEDLHILFQYGGVHGYAGERGDGEGRYVATITKEAV